MDATFEGAPPKTFGFQVSLEVVSNVLVIRKEHEIAHK